MRRNLPALKLSVIALPLIAFGHPAAAQHKTEGIYLRIDSGYSLSRDANGDLGEDVGASPILAGGIGYRIHEVLRTDLTFGYRGGYEVDYATSITATAVTAQGDISSLSGFLNLYADLDRWGPLQPYIGAGIGLSQNEVRAITGRAGGSAFATINGATKTSLAWQAMAGLSLAFTYNAFLDIGYHYVDLGEAETADNGRTSAGATLTGLRSSGNLRAHEIQVGLRWQF